MQRDTRAYIFDLQRFTRELQDVVSSSRDQTGERIRYLAIERLVILIATMIQRLDAASPELRERIDHADAIRAFRNVIVHEYDEVDPTRMMGELGNGLPQLRRQVDAWAAELNMPEFDWSQVRPKKHLE